MLGQATTKEESAYWIAVVGHSDAPVDEQGIGAQLGIGRLGPYGGDMADGQGQGEQLQSHHFG